MSLTHHPDDELLETCTSGAGDAGASLLVATHLTYCSKCRDETSVLETLGGALLSDMPPSALHDDAFENVVARLENTPVKKPVRASSVDIARPMPAPLRAYAGADLDRVRWRHVSPGLSYRMLMKQGQTRVYLTKSKPGSGNSLHTHRGIELTLVLAGGIHR